MFNIVKTTYAAGTNPSDFIDQFDAGIGMPHYNSPSEIVNAILPSTFTIAGLILLVMLIYGGFTMLTAANSPEQAQKGQAIIMNAFIGFIILFASYWIAQIVQILTGFNILG
jgi:uncharacterized membrane protein